MNQHHRTVTGIRQFEKQKPKGAGFYLFEAGSIVATASVTLGVVVLGWQGMTWQQSGTWHGVSLMELLQWLGLSLTAYGEAASLQGAAAVVQLLLSLPAFVMVPALGMALFMVTSLFARSGR